MQQSLLVWVSVLHFSLLFSTVWSLSANAAQLSGVYFYGNASYEALAWISSIFHALAYATVIVIARNPVWKPAAFAEEQQYAYHQEAPVYEGAQRA